MVDAADGVTDKVPNPPLCNVPCLPVCSPTTHSCAIAVTVDVISLRQGLHHRCVRAVWHSRGGLRWGGRTDRPDDALHQRHHDGCGRQTHHAGIAVGRTLFHRQPASDVLPVTHRALDRPDIHIYRFNCLISHSPSHLSPFKPFFLSDTQQTFLRLTMM